MAWTSYFSMVQSTMIYVRILFLFLLGLQCSVAQPSKVYKDWDKLDSLSSGNPASHKKFLKGVKVLDQSNNIRKAKRLFDAALRLDSLNNGARVVRAICYWHADEPQKAIQDLSFLIKKDSDVCTYWAILGCVHSYLEDYPKAIPILEGVNKDCPNARTRYFLGESYFRTDRYQEAVEQLTLMLKINPTIARGYDTRGKALLELKEYQRAIEDLLTARKLYTRRDIKPGTFRSLYFELAWAEVELGNYEEAETYLRKSTGSKPHEGDYFLYGKLELGRGNLEKAEEYFGRCKDHEVFKDYIYLYFSKVEAKRGNLQKAEQILTEGMKEFGQTSWALEERADIWVRLNELEKACEDFKEAAAKGSKTVAEKTKQYCR